MCNYGAYFWTILVKVCISQPIEYDNMMEITIVNNNRNHPKHLRIPR